MYDYMQDAESVASDIAKSYQQSTEYIQSQIENIFKNFKTTALMSDVEAVKLLRFIPGDDIIAELRKSLATIENADLRNEILKQLSAPAYRARIDRLQAIIDNTRKKCDELYHTELAEVNNSLAVTTNEAYYRTMYDIQKGTGYAFSFANMSASRVNEILRNKWSGQHYSTRIWGRTSLLKDTLKNELISGFMTGKSNAKMSQRIADTMGVNSFYARRLIRTETNYVANQAEAESYKECGIEKYKYVATLDSRTSPICQRLEGKVFTLKEQQPGVNAPPMHSWCRSTTVPIIEGDTEEGLKRRARDKNGKPIMVDGNMTYSEWLNKNSLTNARGKHIIEVKRTRLKALPGSITQKESAKGGVERNYYGDDGKQFKQVSNSHHGKPKSHPYGKNGEHAHDYIYDEDGNLMERPIRELTDEERKENADIL